MADSVRLGIWRTFAPAFAGYRLTLAFARVMSCQLYRGRYLRPSVYGGTNAVSLAPLRNSLCRLYAELRRGARGNGIAGHLQV